MSQKFTDGYALIVGAGGDLPNTVDDAAGLAGILKDAERCAYPPQQVHLLTGEQATRAAILDALDALARSTTPQSTLLFYFSGHGYRVTSPTGVFTYLMPFGYDLQRLYQTAVAGMELTQKLRAIPAQKTLVLLDCCHAGGIGEEKAVGMQMAKSPLPAEALTLLAEGRGRVLVASSQADELSYAGKPYSAFTLALIEALCGVGVAQRDGAVRVADLALHAREVVPARTKGRQHPILHFEQADNFVLGYYAGGANEPKGLPFAQEPEIEPEPGAWRGIVLSGTFAGPVAVGGGEAVDMRGAQGVVYKPGGPVDMQFGDRITIAGDQTAVGDGNTQVRIGSVSGSVVNIGAGEPTCPSCGQRLPPGARFCPLCGRPVG